MLYLGDDLCNTFEKSLWFYYSYTGTDFYSFPEPVLYISSKLNIFVTSCGPLKVALIELVVAQKQALQISQLFIFLAYQFNMAIISPHCDYKVLN